MFNNVFRPGKTRRFALAALLAAAAALSASTPQTFAQTDGEPDDIAVALAEMPEADPSQATSIEIEDLELQAVVEDSRLVETDSSLSNETPDTLTGPGIEVSKGCGANYLPGEWIRAEIVAHGTGWHSISLSHAAGSASLGQHYLSGGKRYWLQFRLSQPLGRYELQMTVPDVLILYRCEFTLGQSSATAPSEKPSIDAAYTADDFLVARSCFEPARRVYFVAQLKNPTKQPQSVAVVMANRGAISSWWAQKIEALYLAPGETRQVLAYADQLPARPSYDYKVELFGSGATGWALIDTEIRSFKVGSCP